MHAYIAVCHTQWKKKKVQKKLCEREKKVRNWLLKWTAVKKLFALCIFMTCFGAFLFLFFLFNYLLRTYSNRVTHWKKHECLTAELCQVYSKYIGTNDINSSSFYKMRQNKEHSFSNISSYTDLKLNVSANPKNLNKSLAQNHFQ